ncbi:MAG: hypothetical protein H8E25_14440, partial [Planctomycetes bacterium]|nr:hypothetical protein [Planctomycetota bacterium]
MSRQGSAFRPVWPFSVLTFFYFFSLFNFFKLNDEGVAGSSLSRVQNDRIIPAERGQILDRNGLVLAEDRGTWNLVVNYLPQHRSLIKNLQDGVWDETEIRRRLAVVSRASGLSVEELYTAVMLTESASQTLLTNLTPIDRENLVQALRSVPYSGLSLVRNFDRIYPNGAVLSHFIGLLAEGNEKRPGRHGGSGLEAGLDDMLAGEDGRSSAINVGRGHGANPALAKIEAKAGASIKTTLDLDVSVYARQQLAKIMDDHDPLHCVALVIDVNTGDVLSAQGLPDYDPGNPLDSMELRVNTVTSEEEYVGWTFPGRWYISPGSTMKPLVASWALENDAIQSGQMFSNKNGEYRLPGRKIHNSSKYRNEDMDFAAAIVHSSNIVFAQIGRALGREKMAEFLPHFGYDPIADPLPGSGVKFQNGKYPEYNSFMRKKGPDGMERNGTEWNGMERNGMERNGTERNGTERNGM